MDTDTHVVRAWGGGGVEEQNGGGNEGGEKKEDICNAFNNNDNVFDQPIIDHQPIVSL